MNLRTFRTVALVEATSFLLLIVATIVKYTTDPMIETGVKILGPIHGALFLVYVFLALVVRLQTKWNFVQTVLILAGAVIPTGGYFVDRWIARNEGASPTASGTK